jgi:hypothetical protein
VSPCGETAIQVAPSCVLSGQVETAGLQQVLIWVVRLMITLGLQRFQVEYRVVGVRVYVLQVVEWPP